MKAKAKTEVRTQIAQMVQAKTKMEQRIKKQGKRKKGQRNKAVNQIKWDQTIKREEKQKMKRK